MVSGMMLTLLLGSMLSYAITLVEGETEIHDLEVSLTARIIKDIYNHLSSGNSTVLNATVVNKGDFNESGVALQLLINGTIVLHATTSRLEINSTFWTAYFWTPDDADYNLTVYAPPVNGEDNITNNAVTKWVRVCPDQPPIPNFTYSPPPPPPGPIKGEVVTFNASDSYDPDWGTILNHTWDFGDGDFGEGVTVNHAYTTWGNKTVTLTLRDTENLTSSTSRNITVYARPIAHFRIDEPEPYFVNETLTFNATDSRDPDNSTAPNKGIMNYRWNFGDGNITSTPNSTINHTYTTEKDYTVILTVTDYHGLVDYELESVRVGLGCPIADFTPPPEPCYACYPLIFDASASYDPNNNTGPTNGIAYFTWNFGDDNTTTVTEPTITHHYQTPRTYNVNLTVTDYEGLTDSINKNVTVSLEVLVKVVDSETGNTTVIHNPGETFTVNITVANVENLYSFYFKLSWPTPWMPPTWLDLFDPVSVTVTDDDCFLGPIQDPVTGQPRIRWEPYPRPHEGYVILNATLLVDEPCSGNGTLAKITFKVAASGNCTLGVSATKLSKSFQSITLIDHTVVNGTFYTMTPVANFTWAEPAVPHENVTFYASSSYDPDNYTAPNHGIANYTWNFDDGTTPVTTSNPIINHNFTDFGIYNVNLTVTDYNKTTWWIQYPVLVGSRNVTITAVEPCPYAFNETLGGYETNGYLPVNVAVKNNGDFKEEFNVTVYADDEVLGTQTVTLEPDQSKNLTYHLCAFLWNETHGLPKGNYTISANATSPPVKTNVTGGWVIVGLTGDVNGDHKVSVGDLVRTVNAVPSTPTINPEKWDPNADIICDGKVSTSDEVAVVAHIGLEGC
jgi:PKD repeat protein